MLFIFRGHDHADGLEIRLENRAAHIAWLKKAGERVRAAGPTLDSDGRMTGSLLIVEAENEAAFRAWLDTDPYKTAGLFERVEIAAFNWAVNPPADLKP